MDLNELADRVEALSGPDRAVAKDIYRALFEVPELSPVEHGYGWREDDSGWWCQTGEDQRVPRQRIDPPNWLGSIDAAMTLTTAGLHLAFDVHFMDDENVIRYRGYSFRPDWAKWNPHDMEWLNRDGSDNPLCATPALAITAAALRSQATSQ